jgi:diacylglycerol kinase family enzyme
MTPPRFLPQHADRVLVAHNPRAGTHSGQAILQSLRQRLTQQGYHCEIESDRDALTQHATRLAALGQLRAVVAAGGDGTATDIWNRLPAGIPVVPLAIGNENLLAGYLGLVRQVEDVVHVIDQGQTTRLDAGQANGRLFSLMCSVGFDADVVRDVDEHRTGHVNRLNYVGAIVRTMSRYRYPKLRVSFPAPSDLADGESVGWLSTEARWLFAFNLPCYGAGLPLAPEATAMDAKLDVRLFRKGSWWNGLGYLASVLLHRQHRLTSAAQWQVSRMRVESDVAVPYQLDGDYGGLLPLELEVVPQRLTTLVSANWVPRTTARRSRERQLAESVA